ncbi:MAG TPA: type II toxin-antitoxin system RelE/ParE family toxin [Gammaproteobacteria bacterium]
MFTRLVQEYVSDDEYREVQAALIKNPEAGVVITGSGGIRKLRWRAPGRGKRGGYRIIYYLPAGRGMFWMLTMYPKNDRSTISASELRMIRKELEDG